MWNQYIVKFDASLMKAGANEMTFTVPAGDVTTGVVWDYLRLELNDGSKAYPLRPTIKGPTIRRWNRLGQPVEEGRFKGREDVGLTRINSVILEPNGVYSSAGLNCLKSWVIRNFNDSFQTGPTA